MKTTRTKVIKAMVEMKPNVIIQRTISEQTELRKKLWYPCFESNKAEKLTQELFFELKEELPTQLINAARREFRERNIKESSKGLFIEHNGPYIYFNRESLIVDFKNSTIDFSTCFGRKQSKIIMPDGFDYLSGTSYLYTSIMYEDKSLYQLNLKMLFEYSEDIEEVDEQVEIIKEAKKMIRKLNPEDVISAVKRREKEEKEREDSLIDKAKKEDEETVDEVFNSSEPKKEKKMYDPLTDFVPYDEIKS